MFISKDQISHIKKIKTIITFFVLLPMLSVSQINIDSLRAIWNDVNMPDTVRLNAFNEIIWNKYIDNQPDSAFYFAQTGFKFAKNRGLKKEMAKALNIQGVSLLYRDNYVNALDYCKRSLIIFEEIKDKIGILNALNNIAITYMKQGNYAEAIDCHYKSLLLSEETNNKEGIAGSLLNIGMIYKRIEEYDKALDYNFRSLTLYENLGDKKSIAKCYNNIGIICSRKEQYDKAQGYYSKALVLHEELEYEHGIANTLSNIGNNYQYQGDYSKAINYQNRSLAIQKRIGRKEGIAGSLLNIGSIFQNIGKYDSAVFYCNSALTIAQEIGHALHIADASKMLYSAYKSKGQTKKALAMYELYNFINDSLLSEENNKEIIRQELKYEYDKKHFSDSLKNVYASDLDIFERQKELEKAKQQQFLIYFIVFLILLILAVLIRNNMIKIRAEKEFLHNEIQIQKSVALFLLDSSTGDSKNSHLDRQKINSAITGVLNDTDWSILSLLCENPTLNNLSISEQTSLSFDKVRYSLKKMYQIFGIQKSTENQRMALVIRAYRISNSI